MYSEYNIICQAYDWNSTVPIKNCNFFSSETATAISDSIDLKEYMLETDTLKINFTFDENDNERNNIYFTASNCVLTLSDWKHIAGGIYLKDFFYMYQTDSDYDRVKFLVKIYKNTQLTWQGIIVRESLSEIFSPDDSDRTIKLQIVGWEKEFRDYYKTVSLAYNPVPVFSGTKASGKKYCSLLTALQANFNITINIPEQSILDWRVCELPEFWQSTTSTPLYFPLCGYYNVNQGGENRFDWLYKLCMSMGWIFYIAPVGGVMKLNIKNRYTFDSNITVLNVDIKDVITANASRLKTETPYNTVIIINGVLTGGTNAFPNDNSFRPEFKHLGYRVAVISNTATIQNNYRHFNSVTVSTTPNKYTFVSASGNSFNKFFSQNDNEIIYTIYTYTSSSANTAVNYPEPIYNTLILNVGENAVLRQRVQLTDGGEAAWANGDTYDDNDLIYSGCYGEMLYQESGGTPYQYQDYMKGTAFSNVIANQLQLNYKSFIQSRNSNLIMEILLKQNIINPLQIIQFMGSSSEVPYNTSVDNKWAIKGLEVDCFEDITNLQLIGKV